MPLLKELGILLGIMAIYWEKIGIYGISTEKQFYWANIGIYRTLDSKGYFLAATKRSPTPT